MHIAGSIMWKRISQVALIACAILATGCPYYSISGGMPSHIKTIGVEFFENTTMETGIEEYITRALSDILVKESQVRYAPPRTADAIVRGKIVGYVNEPLTHAAGAASQFQVRISVDAEVWDRVKRRTIWKRSGLQGQAAYNPSGGFSSRQKAFQTAFADIAREIVDGMKSGW
jgi:lipopolysaccharide assembly LptE-like protein